MFQQPVYNGGRLLPAEGKLLDDWCIAGARTAGIELSIERVPERGGIWMRHPRKLLIEFADGAKLSTLKIALEHGLDWAKPKDKWAPDPWTARIFQAEETFVLVLEDYELALERDADGVSEWTSIFGDG